MAATRPDIPGTPTRLSTTETSISIQWTAPTDNGGTPITDYTVMWDQGLGGIFVTLGSSQNQLTYTVMQQLVTDRAYRFQVRATNYIGDGPLSNAGAIISASLPDTPAPPTILASTGNQITLQLSPVYDGGSPLLSYRIFMSQPSSVAFGRRL